MASIAACHWDDDAESIAAEAEAIAQDTVEITDMDGEAPATKIVNGGLGIFLAICASMVLISGNYKKVKMIIEYIKPQPEIHQIMPNTVRNAQLAWLCNFKMLAVLLESTSLTEYMIELGGPVLPGK